ncbi:hypothetical protein BLNAU_1133 [Blattamonas nauphoetae]|uniref:Uncharacterized protein n=1 Tax=Blattamonas nauphoetae TaxID=2049346 RepID=A0ABQ9YJW0_9EUKA|nr:hypothetical protein BLNAU_1133 [Blattamonas nauphoetae]
MKNRKGYGNELSVLNTEDLNNYIISAPAGDYIIQRFVQSRGLHPWIARAVWRSQSTPFAYTITSSNLFSDDTEGDFRKRFTVCTDIPQSCQVTKTTGSAVAEPISYTQNIVEYVKRQHGIHFDELVADFIKDTNDKWWFLQVKAFKVSPETMQRYKEMKKQEDETGKKGTLIPRANKKQEYVRVGHCKSCAGTYPPHELVHDLTYKMIVRTINHLEHRDTFIDFFNRTDLKQRDRREMTRVFTVCNSCYDLYQSEKRLSIVEKQFAKSLGITINTTDAGDFMISEPDCLERVVVTKPSDRRPKTPTSSTVQLETVAKNVFADHPNMKLYRVLIALHTTFNLPPGEYTLVYQLLGSTVAVPFRAEPMEQSLLLPDSEETISIGKIDKLHLHYMYADEAMMKEFLTEAQRTIRIVCLTGVHQFPNTLRQALPTRAMHDQMADVPLTPTRPRTVATNVRGTPQSNTRAGSSMSIRSKTAMTNKRGTSPTPHTPSGRQSSFGARPITAASTRTLKTAAGRRRKTASHPSSSAVRSYFGEFEADMFTFNAKNESSRHDYILDLKNAMHKIGDDPIPQLKMTVAFAPSSFSLPPKEKLEEVPMWHCTSVLIPHLSFFTCEPLPEDWILLLPQNKASQNRELRMFKRTGHDWTERSGMYDEDDENFVMNPDAQAVDGSFFTDNEQPMDVFEKVRKQRARRKTTQTQIRPKSKSKQSGQMSYEEILEIMKEKEERERKEREEEEKREKEEEERREMEEKQAEEAGTPKAQESAREQKEEEQKTEEGKEDTPQEGEVQERSMTADETPAEGEEETREQEGEQEEGDETKGEGDGGEEATNEGEGEAETTKQEEEEGEHVEQPEGFGYDSEEKESGEEGEEGEEEGEGENDGEEEEGDGEEGEEDDEEQGSGEGEGEEEGGEEEGEEEEGEVGEGEEEEEGGDNDEGDEGEDGADEEEEGGEDGEEGEEDAA